MIAQTFCLHCQESNLQVAMMITFSVTCSLKGVLAATLTGKLVLPGSSQCAVVPLMLAD